MAGKEREPSRIKGQQAWKGSLRGQDWLNVRRKEKSILICSYMKEEEGIMREWGERCEIKGR